VDDSEPGRNDIGTLFGVGVGPGDPGLMTISAYKAILNADLVVAPSASVGQKGHAETIVRHHFPYLDIQRLHFPTTSATNGISSSLEAAAAFDEAALKLRKPLESGRDIAFITLGDPNLFSTFTALRNSVARILPGVKVRTIPGIMAFQALAAQSNTPLAGDDQSLEIVTAHRSPDKLEEALDKQNHTVVVYKSGRSLQEIVEILHRHGRLETARAGEFLGMPEERYGTLQELLELRSKGASYFTTVLIPPLQRDERSVVEPKDNGNRGHADGPSRHLRDPMPINDKDVHQ